MKKFIWTRGMWKTTQMLKYINWKWIYIVCHDQNDVDNLWKRILDEKLDIPMPITLNEAIGWWNKIFVENVDLVLNNIKDDWIIEPIWIDFKINIEETLKWKYLKRWWKIEWYTQNIPDEFWI